MGSVPIAFQNMQLNSCQKKQHKSGLVITNNSKKLVLAMDSCRYILLLRLFTKCSKLCHFKVHEIFLNLNLVFFKHDILLVKNNQTLYSRGDLASDFPDPGSRHTRALKSIEKRFEDCIIGKAHIGVLSSSTTQKLIC